MAKKCRGKSPYLSSNLYTIRKYAVVSQQEIADSIGVERTTYTKWEIGTEPSYYHLSKIIKFYNDKGVSLDYNMLLSAPIQITLQSRATGEIIMNGKNDDI